MNFLRGCTFGIISSNAASRAALADLLHSLGGAVARGVGAHGVNLIATGDASGVNLSALAEEFAQPILTEAWVRACVVAGAFLNPDDFAITPRACAGPSLLADVNVFFGYASRRAADAAADSEAAGADADAGASASAGAGAGASAAKRARLSQGVAQAASPDGAGSSCARPHREWGGDLSHSGVLSSPWLSPAPAAGGATESSGHHQVGGALQRPDASSDAAAPAAAAAVATGGVFSIYGSSSGSSRKDEPNPASTGTSGRIDAIANAPLLFSPSAPPSAPLAQSQWVFSTQLPTTDVDANTQALHGSATARHARDSPLGVGGGSARGGGGGDGGAPGAGVGAGGGIAAVLASSDSRSSYNVGGSPDDTTTGGAGAVDSRKREEELTESQQQLLDLWSRQRDAELVSFSQIERDGRI
jgi:hypothetical protein